MQVALILPLYFNAILAVPKFVSMILARLVVVRQEIEIVIVAWMMHAPDVKTY